MSVERKFRQTNRGKKTYLIKQTNSQSCGKKMFSFEEFYWFEPICAQYNGLTVCRINIYL